MSKCADRLAEELMGRSGRGVVLLGLALGILVGLSAGSRGQVSPDLAARLSGKGLPDFTVTYRCRSHNRLPHLTEKEVRARVVAALKRVPWPPGQKEPKTRVEDAVQRVMSEIPSVDRDPVCDFTVSQRGGSLLYIYKFPFYVTDIVVVYDGSRTLLSEPFLEWEKDSRRFREWPNRRQIEVLSGLQYSSLSRFIFPGFGVAGIAMAIQPIPSRSHPHTYGARLGSPDGWTGKSRIPEYLPGVVTTTNFGGAEVVVDAVQQATDPESHSYHTTFSDYRRVGPSLLLPSSVQMRLTYTPYWASGLKRGEWHTADYTLLSASPKPLPERAFVIDRYLEPNSTVHGGRQPNARLQIVPGRETFDQQLDQILSWERDWASLLAHQKAISLAATASRRRKPGSRTAGVVVGVIAVAAALFGALRFARARKGGPNG